ncbi:hypothetical protein MML48_9g00001466 [Holotrichia oblita]|uniref:Uncharacterized protein n=1 Tax=Holotrichia oblita TaxID=644536 RepID=A0ACB9SKP5_HOLOL|nr:hypothetical protein MML48_9g00001466 [Holotrichia oblita]
MANKWKNEDTTIKFVEYYREHECLWNVSLPIYKNKQPRESAIQKIVEAMNIPDFKTHDVKNKIKNLKSTYNQELIKIRKSEHSGMGTEDCYKPKIKWFAAMHGFIKFVDKKRESYSNLDEEQLIPNDQSQTQEVQQPNQYSQDEVQETAQNDNFHAPRVQPTPKRPKVSKRLKEVASCVNELKSLAGSLQLAEQPEDEFAIFGQSVAAQLKKMPLGEAICAQEEIQALLTRYRLRHINRAQQPLHSPGTSHSTCSSPGPSCGFYDSQTQSQYPHDDTIISEAMAITTYEEYLSNNTHTF